MLLLDGVEDREGVPQPAGRPLHPTTTLSDGADGESHRVRVVEVVNAGDRFVDFVLVCETCGWVSLPTIWRPVLPVRCDVAEVIRQGARNRRIFEHTLGGHR